MTLPSEAKATSNQDPKRRHPVGPRAVIFSLTVVALFVSNVRAAEPLIVPLWPGDAPGSAGRSSEGVVRVTDSGDHVLRNVHRPTIAVFLPDRGQATGAGVIIVPGGRGELWLDHEGFNPARWLRDHGVAAFVLRHRRAGDDGSGYTIAEHELPDLQRALRLIRFRAAEWQLNPAQVGVMGFSTGGELAARASMDYDAGNPDASDPVARLGSKPAFQALLYPVNAENIQPTADSPPSFIAWGYSEWPEITAGLNDIFPRFQAVGVPVELHVYADAGHGFGYRPDNDKPVGQWIVQFRDWLAGVNSP